MDKRKALIKVAIVKIAPGLRAEYWPQCLRHGYICVGWDEMGDLGKYRDREEFRKSFERLFRNLYGGRLPTLRQKGNELWMLTKLQPGDRVIANKGMGEVLALGVVQEPGYVWQPSKARPGFYHTVRVKWDTSFARKIAKQPWNQTVAQVKYEVFNRITGSRLSPDQVRDLNEPVSAHNALDGIPPSQPSIEASATEKAEEENEKSQGFQSNPKIRKCIENHAMELVRSKFEHDGYQVEDVHARRPFDLLCTKGRLAKHVEVKGTQSDGSAIILTAGEVAHVRKNPRNCVLCVVH